MDAFTPIDKAELLAAVDQVVAGTYGGDGIALWNTAKVKDMSYVFCGSSSYQSYGCSSAKASFNGDISKWNVASVTTM